ncbi:hypothetical protein ACFSE1_00765 [Rhizobium helianthi]|uniref:Uncharacterized protein n=1 Tax=Rhizobium helianthi TaxID=1132695 RepID=A0ABW4M087_9HYPH
MRIQPGLLAAAALFSLAITGPAMAISRYNSTAMTCEAVQRTIAREGAVIFRYKGRTGATLYDRYVADERFCAGGEFAKSGTIPTRDIGNCPVRHCEMRPSPEDCSGITDEGCFGWR